MNMKKNCIIYAAAIALMLAGCSSGTGDSSAETSSEAGTVSESADVSSENTPENAPDENKDGELIRVTSYDGKTLTGTKMDMPSPDGQGGQGGPGGPGGENPPEMNGEAPEMPDGENPPEMNGEAPQMPDGENPPEMNGEAPEMPDGENPPEMNGEAPEKPDGENPPEMNGEAPEKPEGENPPEMNGEAPQMPEGGNPAEMGGEEVTYTVSEDVQVSEEISEGDTVRIITDENGVVTSITKEDLGGGMGMGAPGGFGGGFGADGTDNGTSANDVSDNDVLTDLSYSSEGDDENALRADNVTATLENVSITKTGSSSNTENGDFYGMNAAFLAQNGANVTITGGEVTTNAVNGNGIFSYGSGTTVNVSGTKIRTSERNSGGIQTTGGGTMNAENLDIKTEGSSSAAIRSDRGGGNVSVSGGTYETSGTGSPAIYCTADITVSGAELTANNSEGVVVEGKNSVKLSDCNLSGSMKGTYNDGSENIQCIMIYQSMSGDADVGEAYFSADGGKITSLAGDMFYVTNTSCKIDLTNVEFIMSDGVFLRAAGNTSERGWGRQGENGGDVVMTLTNQTVSGDIAVDEISSLDLTMTASNLTGAVNSENSGGEINITLDESSVWTLTADSYVTSFSGDVSQITAGEYHLYVNGEMIV
jgi:hypothetical protein